MKKRQWYSSARRRLTLEEMKKMPTKRLLAYKRSLFHLDEFSWECDDPKHDCSQIREFFIDQMDKLHEVLATREHVDRPGKGGSDGHKSRNS